jgi:hypothetical protein
MGHAGASIPGSLGGMTLRTGGGIGVLLGDGCLGRFPVMQKEKRDRSRYQEQEDHGYGILFRHSEQSVHWDSAGANAPS